MARNSSEQINGGKSVDEAWQDDMLQVISTVEISNLKLAITPEQLIEYGKMLIERSPAKTGLEEGRPNSGTN